MKRITVVLLAWGLIAVPPQAGAWSDYTVVGAVAGAAAGLVLANNVDHWEPEVAVPVMAVLGGLVGHEYGRYFRHHRRHGIQVLELVPAEPQRPRPNLHPGVELLVVNIPGPTGMEIPVRILHVGNAYIGPRGERWSVLPAPETLARELGFQAPLSP